MTITILIILGLCFGSFVNAFVWRLHLQEKPSKKREKRYSITKGRSMCPNCKHELNTSDLIPLFSWLWLNGKCRYCKKPISWQYPTVELATALVFVTSYLYWPAEFVNLLSVVDFIIWLAITVGLITLLVYDLRWMLLPNRIIFPLIGLASFNLLIQSIYNSDFSLLSASFLSALIGGGIFYILFQISDGRWIGGGDVKLGFLLGLMLSSPALAFLLLFVASLLGTIVSLPLLASKSLSKSSKLPFGPFLIVGVFIVKLFGQELIDVYLWLLII